MELVPDGVQLAVPPQFPGLGGRIVHPFGGGRDHHRPAECPDMNPFGDPWSAVLVKGLGLKRYALRRRDGGREFTGEKNDAKANPHWNSPKPTGRRYGIDRSVSQHAFLHHTSLTMRAAASIRRPRSLPHWRH